jgi:ATP citrate (pro-S)-lyase
VTAQNINNTIIPYVDLKGSKRISINSPTGALSQSTRVNRPDTTAKVDFRQMFSKTTKSIVWGMQTRAVQSMLDFDFICRREDPSVVAMVYPFTGYHRQKFYWGHKEILIPVYSNMSDAINKHKDVDVLVNFASLRSAYESTLEVINDFPQIRTIAIIAEGIPENMTRKLNVAAHSKGVSIIGPATVGGVKPGCFKIGNTGGMLDNILHSKLYRPGRYL